MDEFFKTPNIEHLLLEGGGIPTCKKFLTLLTLIITHITGYCESFRFKKFKFDNFSS